MVGIAEEDREKLRFLWLENPFDTNSRVIEYKFNRLAFGLQPSPVNLGAIIANHLSKFNGDDPTTVKLIQDSLYVDDLICGKTSIEQAFKVYRESKGIMAKGGVNLRKWNSNSPELLHRIKIAESVLNSASNVPESQTSVSKEGESYVS